MSEPTAGAPEWDTADRLRKSLRQSELQMQQMADYLGVSHTSVSNWINGRVRPSKQTMRLWSLRCGVPLDWLEGKSGNRSFPTTDRSLRAAA